MSQKLKQARAAIEKILKRYDIAGHVVLHEPNYGEVFMNLTPSYSKLSGTPPLMRLRSMVADYGGDREARRADLEATANMVAIMAELMASNALIFLDLKTWIDAKLGAKHTDSVFEPDGSH
jgi:hypothetical protein